MIPLEPSQNVPTPGQIAIKEEFREKLRALYRRDQFAIHAKVLAFHDELKMKYPDAREYLMFHLISGSTLRSFNGKFDFPPGESVEEFIEREYRQVIES